MSSPFVFFNDTATTEIYTLSLHDALPIYGGGQRAEDPEPQQRVARQVQAEDVAQRDVEGAHLGEGEGEDRKSTRLNSSHANISYAVFCLKKKKNAYTPSVSHTLVLERQLA